MAVHLSEREQDVILLMVKNQSYTDMARILRISRATVKSNVRSAYKRLGVHTREDAIKAFRANGLMISGS